MTTPYELGTAAPARRALSDRLPPEVAPAAVEFVTGPLLENPQRVGKPLTDELAGIRSARLGRNWRILYEIDYAKYAVIVLDIRPRSTPTVRLRSEGLRPVQIWVTEVRAPGFAAEAHRQSSLAAASSHEAEDQAFVDAVSWFGSDDEDEV